jgi:hypothetical protein
MSTSSHPNLTFTFEEWNGNYQRGYQQGYQAALTAIQQLRKKGYTEQQAADLAQEFIYNELRVWRSTQFAEETTAPLLD